VAERYFSPEEVNALVPALTRIMERVMPAHRAAAELAERLHDEQRRIALVGGAVVDRASWQADRAQLEELTAVVREGLREVTALGGVPKDLDVGLVDFLHRRGGRDVNLCWKYGERDVRYWHGLDEGYAGRKPL
jgi:hypothetical protein